MAARPRYEPWGFAVGDRVRVVTANDYANTKVGTIQELWTGSEQERISGRFGLDKYNVLYADGTGSSWRYGSDLIHTGPQSIALETPESTLVMRSDEPIELGEILSSHPAYVLAPGQENKFVSADIIKNGKLKRASVVALPATESVELVWLFDSTALQNMAYKPMASQSTTRTEGVLLKQSDGSDFALIEGNTVTVRAIEEFIELYGLEIVPGQTRKFVVMPGSPVSVRRKEVKEKK